MCVIDWPGSHSLFGEFAYVCRGCKRAEVFLMGYDLVLKKLSF